MKLSIYRFNPDIDKKPYMENYDVKLDGTEIMLLDVLIKVKGMDDSFSMRMSCREGVCGSDSMNINGKNGLACITKIEGLKGRVVIRPMPGLPVIKDLIPDLTHFYAQHASIMPWLETKTNKPATEWRQSIEDRKKLDGLYECVMCACCSTSCPSYWWNGDRNSLGPAASTSSIWRFIADTRDLEATVEQTGRTVSDPFSVYRCHGIMNCVSCLPKRPQSKQGNW